MSSVMTRARTCPRCHGRFEGDALFCPRDGAPLDEPGKDEPEQDAYLGTVLGNDIELKSVAGVGAMGRVYRAHQRGMDRDVAVKILHRELSSNKQLVARFHREAKIASKLQHPHVVEVYFVGQLPDGALYMVMEFLDGVSLSEALTKTGGPFTVDRVVSIGLQVCDAVGEGHARGIIHRDLKPENVMLVRRSDVEEWAKVLDFGIARLTLGEQSMETAAGLIFGTARYISPEGAQGRPVGPQADVYALATMLYQLLVGRTPFEAEPLGLLIKHIHELAPDIQTVARARGIDIPAPIAKVIMDNLAKEPADRAATGRVLAAQLVAAAREAGVPFADVGVAARLDRLLVVPAPASTPRIETPGFIAALDPTLDDMPAPEHLPPPAILHQTPSVAMPEGTASPTSQSLAPAAPSAPRRLWPTVAAVLVAFVLGGAAASFASRRSSAQEEDTERHAYALRVREALAEGHYMAPPGNNVRALVAAGLERWPEDIELRQMRSEGEKEMITLAFAARSSGDLVGARNLARDALTLEGTDNSARYMRAQTEEELESAINGASAKVGPPRLILESPGTAKPGEHLLMKARIIFGTVPTTTHPTGMKVSLEPNGKNAGGRPVSLTSTAPDAIRAEVIAPTVGSWDLAFEANVGGTIVRAMRDLDVTP